MPGIGCLENFYIVLPGNPKIRTVGFLEIPISGNPDFQMSGDQDFRKSDFCNSGKPENLDFQISDFPDFRKIGKAKIK